MTTKLVLIVSLIVLSIMALESCAELLEPELPESLNDLARVERGEGCRKAAKLQYKKLNPDAHKRAQNLYARYLCKLKRLKDKGNTGRMERIMLKIASKKAANFKRKMKQFAAKGNNKNKQRKVAKFEAFLLALEAAIADAKEYAKKPASETTTTTVMTTTTEQEEVPPDEEETATVDPQEGEPDDDDDDDDVDDGDGNDGPDDPEEPVPPAEEYDDDETEPA